MRLVSLFSLALAFSFSGLRAEKKILDPDFHHIRNAEPREWSHFPEKAAATSLKLEFDLETPAEFKLLTLRQEETKQPWEVLLNDQKIGLLQRDHNHLEHGIAIPDGLLKATGNTLVIKTKSEKPDDIRVGDIALHSEIYSPVDQARAADLLKKRGFQRGLPMMEATLNLSCVDADSKKPIPCRFTIVDAQTGALVFLGAESNETLAVREGVIYSLDGKATTKIADGRTVNIFCGRGFEYSLAEKSITVKGSAEVNFEIRREVATPGLVACDTHLHTYEFDRHGDCTMNERLISVAGEGVELAISTGHDKHVSIPASPHFTSVLGCEVTTSLGHFNTFPIVEGSTPAEHKLRPWPQIFENIFKTPGVEICILNHGRDVHRNFTPLAPENFDPKTGTFTGGRKLRANGIELINSGAQQTDPMQIVNDWFAMLKSGHKIAGVGSSDSHTVNFAIPGQGRTYLEADDSDPSQIDIDAAVESFLAGKTWTSFGLLTRLELDPKSGGATVRVSGPHWTECDRVRVFRNGELVLDEKINPEEQRLKLGEKFAQTYSLSDFKAEPGDFLCAVATGPGITAPWWPMMPPYQPDSPKLEPFVIGISPAVWIK